MTRTAQESTRPKDQTLDYVATVYNSPLLELVYHAATVHRQHHDPRAVQRCSLLSVKTGGCPEDCAYCPQSIRHETPVEDEPLLSQEEVLVAARRERAKGSSRFCMGAAWRQVRDGADFQAILEMVRGVAGLGMEVCVTLGMLELHQAKALKAAGLTAYNHNLDSSPEVYEKIISTRSYSQRLDTLEAVAAAGLHVCCGGIIGLGESDEDRIKLLHTLATLDPQPESVPINLLVRVEGTPLATAPLVDPMLVVRSVATARILMPRSRVRLSAGRKELSLSTQALCFLAGANSLFAGDRLLTTPNQSTDQDRAMLDSLGLYFPHE